MDAARLTFDFPSWKFVSSTDSCAATDERQSLLEDLDALSSDDDLEEQMRDTVASPVTTSPATARAFGSWPDDVLFAVVSHLNAVADMCAARGVAQRWREVASSDSLWLRFWHAHPRYAKRSPRIPCGARAFEAPPTPHPRFDEYAARCRAQHCYAWFDLQKGWDRLEVLLAPEHLGTPSGSAQARKLSTILAARDWEQLHRCVLLLQIECAESICKSIIVRERHPVSPAVVAAQTATIPAPATADQFADERLLKRLLVGWQSYSTWLSHLCGAFAHHAGTPCRAHLICLLAGLRSHEQVDQYTPSLLHAGFGAFRQAVLCHADVMRALQRHVQRSTASVMAQGGFTVESGRLMQQLLDLQDLCVALDVRDDHLCEERGERFTQDHMREALLTPIKKFWRVHSRSWRGPWRVH